jgi:hypothetical protein
VWVEEKIAAFICLGSPRLKVLGFAAQTANVAQQRSPCRWMPALSKTEQIIAVVNAMLT